MNLQLCKIQEKDRRRPGAIMRSRSPVLCIAVFSANPLYKQTNTTHPKHFSFCFLDPINMFLFQNLQRKIIILSN